MRATPVVGLFASLAAHGAVIGALWLARSPVVVAKRPTSEPIVFELVKAVSEGADGRGGVPPPPVVDQDAADGRGGVPLLPVVDQGAADGRGGVPPPPAIVGPMLEIAAGDGTPALPETTGATRQVVEERAKVLAAPEALNRITPQYPRSARRRRHEGSVTVEFAVDAEGQVGAARVVASSGHAELDCSALEAVRGARFAPAKEDGVSVSANLSLTFDFRLR